jgi:hypothetical protein
LYEPLVELFVGGFENNRHFKAKLLLKDVICSRPDLYKGRPKFQFFSEFDGFPLKPEK